ALPPSPDLVCVRGDAGNNLPGLLASNARQFRKNVCGLAKNRAAVPPIEEMPRERVRWHPTCDRAVPGSYKRERCFEVRRRSEGAVFQPLSDLPSSTAAEVQ